MPFQRPTLPELQSRIKADIDSRLPSEAGTKRGDVLDTLSKVLAGALHSQYGAVSFFSEQVFPDTAEAEYLDRQLQYRGIFRIPATFSSGRVKLTGTAGTVMPSGITLKTQSGVRLETASGGTMDSNGALEVEARALTAGTEGNLAQGVSLGVVTPVAGLAQAEVGAGNMTGGAEAESDTAYRTRGLSIIQGDQSLYGKSGDFARWANNSPTTITRAFETRNNANAGYLLIQVLSGNSAPSPWEISVAEDYIRARAPVGVIWEVRAPEIIPVTLTLKITPDTADNRDKVRDKLSELFDKLEPGMGVTKNQMESVAKDGTGVTSANVVSPIQDLSSSPTQYLKLNVDDVTYV